MLWQRWLAGLCLWLAGWLPVWAQNPPARDEAPPVSLERTAEGVFLSARLPLQMPASVEDALRKGVPLHFVWHAEIVRSRWLWWDQKIVSATRTVRLAYQPLTRRWRVSNFIGEAGATSPNALHQNVETLAEAVAAVFRVSGWQVAEPGAWEARAQDRLRLRFQLDQTLLPKPFQIGSGGDWSIAYEVTLPLPALTVRTEGND